LVPGSNPGGPTNILRDLPEVSVAAISLSVGARNAPIDWPAPNRKHGHLAFLSPHERFTWLGMDIAEIITHVALNIFTNYFNSVTEAEVDRLCARKTLWS
jgi:hypothetical protein